MNEPVAPQSDPKARRDRQGEPAMSDKTTSGAKGLAIVLGAMLGIIGLLWLVAALVAPR